MNIIFFGSTDDSLTVLSTLTQSYPVAAVVTQQPKPVGRKKIIRPTPVEVWATTHHIQVLTFPNNPKQPWRFVRDEDVINAISPFHPELIITACFGERIPRELIEMTPHGGINVHPSLLPRWRGADPIPWAIIAGDVQTGVTIATITEHFDDGRILSQKKIPLSEKDMPDELRKKLFTMGADLLLTTLPEYLSGKNKGIPQKQEDVTVARRLTRGDGFIPWNEFFEALQTDSHALDIKFRAFYGWPGVWTRAPFNKRLKLIALSPSPHVQLEGKQPVDWHTFQKAYLPS